MIRRRLGAFVAAVATALAVGTVSSMLIARAATVTPPGGLPTSSTDEAYPAGSYIIDLGASLSGGVQTKPNGLRPYGLLYELLVKRHVPVVWAIKDGKTGGRAGITPATATSDFTAYVQVDRSGATDVAKSYRSGAFIIPADYVDSSVLAAVALFESSTVVDVANQSFTAPTFTTLRAWPKAVLDATNGAIAAGYYANAGIPVEQSAYVFKAPSQLTTCDDVYVMPHADPTWTTHRYLLDFNNQGGAIWAACHAVSVLESIRNPADATVGLNFLSEDRLTLYSSHGGGSVPYEYSADGSDPVMQFIGPVDAATLNGSEQIFVPAAGTQWRPTTKNLVWDASWPLNTSAARPTDEEARVITYGRGFGQADNGLVMYEAGHSHNKGSADDVAAQRAFFNFVLLNGIERGIDVTVAPLAATIGSGATVAVSATVDGGNPAYGYQWESNCGGAFATPSGTLTVAGGTISTSFTAPAVASARDCAVRLVITDGCGRVAFGADSTVVGPTADLAVTKTVDEPFVAPGGTVQFTVSVTNHGPSDAAGISVVDTLPTGLDLVSATGSPAVAGQVLTWSVPGLATDQSTSFTVVATASGTGTLDNSVTVSSTTTDPNPANNTAIASTAVVSGAVTVTKSARPEVVPAAGGSVTYTYEVRNGGGSALHVDAIVDNPTCSPIVWDPSGDRNGDGLIDPTRGSTDGEVWRATCTRVVDLSTDDADRAVGDATAFRALDPLPGTKQNVVKITATDRAGNVVEARDAATVTVSQPSVQITKALEPATQRPAPGEQATFRITVTNDGNLPLAGLATNDIWSGDCTSATLPALDVAESTAFVCNATVAAPTPLASSDFDAPGTPDATGSYAGGSGWSGPWTENGEATSATAGNLAVVDASALPSGYSAANVLQVQGNSTSVQRTADLSAAGDVLLRFRYHRPAAFNGSSSSGLLVQSSPDGTTWTTLRTITPLGAATADGGWTVASAVVADLGAATRIRIGGDASFGTDPIYVDDVELLGPATNSVTVTAADPFGAAVTDTATADVPLGVTALTLTKSADAAGVRDGDTLTYTLTVTNAGTTTQTGVQIDDSLPAGLGLVSAGGTVPGATVATEAFDAIAYNGGAGWSGNWTEFGESTDPGANDVRVLDGTALSLPSGYSLPYVERIKNKDNGVGRLVDLAGAGSATVSFKYLRTASFNVTAPSIEISFQSTVDGGSTWTTLPAGTVTPSGTGAIDSAWTTFSASMPVPTAPDLGGFRIIAGHANRADDVIYVDDVTIERAAVAATGLPSPSFDLDPGESVTWTVVTTVDDAPDDGLVFANVATATSDNQTTPVTAAASTPYLAPDFTLTKTADREWVNEYDPATHTVQYTIEVRNTGNTALTPTSVSDPLCDAAPLYAAGDADSDGTVDLAEVWSYTCSRTISGTPFSPTPVPKPNTATATLTAPDGAPLTRTGDALVTVAHPRLDLTVTPAATTVRSTGTVDYTYSVANTGNVDLDDPAVTAANCSEVTYRDGDTDTDGVLDIGETWTYRCSTDPILVDQTAVAVTATATDPIFASTPTDTEHVDVDVIDPALTITKSATDSVGSASGNPITVSPSNSVTYTYVVTNTGDVELTPDQPFDDRCSPLTYVSGDAGSPGVLSPGEAWTYQCGPMTLASTTVNTAVVTASFSEIGLSGTVSSDPVTARVTVLQPALLLTKQADTQYVRAGTDVHYTFSVHNSGETAFTQAGLGAPTDTVDELGGAAACATITGPYDAPTGGSAIAAGVDLQPGDTWFYRCVTTVHDRVLDVFAFPNAVDVLGAQPPLTLGTEQVFVLDPDITVTKVATTGIDGPGDDVFGTVDGTVTYTIDVTGSAGRFTPGPGATDAAVRLVTVDDPLCSAPAVASRDGGGLIVGDSDGDELLDPGETHRYSCTLDHLPTGSPTVNTVTVTGRIQARALDDNGDPVRADDGLADLVRTASATVIPAGPALGLVKDFDGFTDTDTDGRIEAGETAAWTITATNTGNVSLTSVTISDPRTGDSKACGTLAAGATCTLSTTAVLTQAELDAGEVVNTASASGTAPGGTVIDADDSDTAPITPDPAITLAKTLDGYTDVDSSGDRSLGDVLTYRFVATNTGNVTLTGVTISDPLAGLSALSCTPVTPASVAPGATVDCTATYTVDQDDVDAGTVVNTATVHATPPTGGPVSGTDSATVPLGQSAALDLVKRVTTGVDCAAATPTASLPAFGGTVTWCFTATNTGTVTLTGVALTDALLGLSPGGTQPDGLPTTLAPGQSVTVSATSVVDEATTNIATATAASGPPATSPPASATVTVAPAPYEVSGIVWIDRNRNNVFDGDELLVPDAEVVLEPDPAATIPTFPRQVRTNQYGAYRFTAVPAGTFRVRAVSTIEGATRTFDSEGAVDWEARVVVVDRNVAADFAAVGTGAIIGIVIDEETGAALAEAPLQCRWSGLDGVDGTDDDASFTAMTDEDGNYELGGLPYGTFACQGSDPRTGETKTFAAEVDGPGPVRRDLRFGEPSLPEGLARTGAELARLVALAGLLIGLGLGVNGLARRRRTG